MFTITFMDFETNNENPVLAEILTGYLKTIRYEKGFYEKRVISELYVEIKPEGKIGDSFGIHGISEERARYFEPKDKELRKIYRYLNSVDGFLCCHANGFLFGKKGYFDPIYLHHNYNFISDDAYFHFGSLRSRFKEISTHTIAKKILGLKSNRLDALAKHFDLPLYSHHDCRSDVITLIALFERLVIGMNINNEDDLFDLANYDGTKKWSQNLELI